MNSRLNFRSLLIVTTAMACQVHATAPGNWGLVYNPPSSRSASEAISDLSRIIVTGNRVRSVRLWYSLGDDPTRLSGRITQLRSSGFTDILVAIVPSSSAVTGAEDVTTKIRMLASFNRGSLIAQVSRWQIGNEPNLRRYWVAPCKIT